MDYFHLSIPQKDLLSVNNLGLAHLGDGVYELLVRSFLVMQGTVRPHELHRATVRYVSASAQAKVAEELLPHLSPEELAVYRRGRNSSPHSIPKAATRAQYQRATGLEALFGWLYLQGQQDRLNELFHHIVTSSEGGSPLCP